MKQSAKFMWTAERTNILLLERSGAVPRAFKHIAAMLGATESSCRDKIKRLELGVDAMPHMVENIKRECLKCSSSFVADGRFTRICGQCKQTSIWQTSNNDFSLVRAGT